MASKFDNCPKCEVSFIGEPIPEDKRGFYAPPYYWRREIGIEVQGEYDGVSYWQCPDCKYTWSRFTGKESKDFK